MNERSQPTTGALVWLLANRWRAGVDRVVAPLGLTHALYSVLANLAALTRHGAQPSQRELADVTELDPVYVSKLIRRLEKDGLVVRHPNPDDARAVCLDLTPRGIQVIRRAREKVRQLNAENLSPLDEEENTRFRSILRALLDATRSPGDPT